MAKLVCKSCQQTFGTLPKGLNLKIPSGKVLDVCPKCNDTAVEAFTTELVRGIPDRDPSELSFEYLDALYSFARQIDCTEKGKGSRNRARNRKVRGANLDPAFEYITVEKS